MKSLRIHVYGTVQGVGFRFFTKRVADQYGTLKGYVRNEYDGSVVIGVQGPDKDVDAFVEAVKASPAPMGYVASIRIVEVPEGDYKAFSIVGY